MTPVLVKQLHSRATLSTCNTTRSIGFDFSTPNAINPPSQTTTIIPTGFSCAILKGLHLQIAHCNSLAICHISVKGDVSNNEYGGEIKVILRNNTPSPLHFPVGENIAQGIFERANKPSIILCLDLPLPPSPHFGFRSTKKRNMRGIIEFSSKHYNVNTTKKEIIKRVRQLQPNTTVVNSKNAILEPKFIQQDNPTIKLPKKAPHILTVPCLKPVNSPKPKMVPFLENY